MDKEKIKKVILKVLEILCFFGAILGTLVMIYCMEEGQTWPSL